MALATPNAPARKGALINSVDVAGLVTHRFGVDEIMQAYDTFADAATTSAIKVILNGREPD